MTWENADTLLVATDYGEGSMTASGYPRIVKRWKRGTPLSAATTVAEGEPEDVGMNVFAFTDGDRRWPMISRGKTFYTTDYLIRGAGGDRYRSTIIPDTASLRDVLDGQAIVFLNKDFGEGFPAGSLISLSLEDMAADRQPLADDPEARGERENVESRDRNAEDCGRVDRDEARRKRADELTPVGEP